MLHNTVESTWVILPSIRKAASQVFTVPQMPITLHSSKSRHLTMNTRTDPSYRMICNKTEDKIGANLLSPQTTFMILINSSKLSSKWWEEIRNSNQIELRPIIFITRANRDILMLVKVAVVLFRDLRKGVLAKQATTLEGRHSMWVTIRNQNRNKSGVCRGKKFWVRARTVNLQSQELSLDKQTLILRLRCIEMRQSRIIYRESREKTWILCSTTSMAHRPHKIIQQRISIIPMGKDLTIEQRVETDYRLERDAIEVLNRIWEEECPRILIKLLRINNKINIKTYKRMSSEHQQLNDTSNNIEPFLFLIL